ncbi:MAG: TRAP transporter small permease subunit [Alphaproteobacteria bacterium]|nr:TRAP transporter small permease subunit [Alphaproteobacteria bacterium]
MLKALAGGIDAVNDAIGRTIAWVSLAMVLVQFAVVVMRYVFGLGSLYMQHSVVFMHAIIFLVAAGYALKDDEHVRIDIFYGRFSPQQRAMMDLAGVLIFLLPFCYLVWITAWPYVLASWRTYEGSLEVKGLPGVFLLKTFILVYVVLLALQGVSMAARAVLTMTGTAPPRALPDQATGEKSSGVT